MKQLGILLLSTSLLGGCASSGFYSQSVAPEPSCNSSGYQCVKVAHNDTWEKVFPDPQLRHMVKAINRTNTHITRHKQLYVPTFTASNALKHYSPLPKKSTRKQDKHVVVDIEKMAYAAYDANGDIQRWGPIAAGKNCNSNPENCLTPKGQYKVFRMKGAECKSGKYPEPTGGAPMPYCMFFNGGIAMHGATLPGYHASHGCVRLLNADAHWLRTQFVQYGTHVFVE